MKSAQLVIACICADLVPSNLGGAEHHVVEVAKRLSKRHKIFLFVGPDSSIKTTLPSSISVVPISYPKIPNLFGLSFIFFGYFQAKKFLDAKSFDLIWAKQSFPQAPLAALLKLKFNKPLYITAQNPLLHQEELVVKGKLLQPFHRLFALFIHPFIKFAYRQSDLIAAVSRYSAALAKQMGAKKIIIIPNGVNPPKAIKLKKNQPLTLITTSSLIPRNGLDTLIDGVALLPKNLNWRLIIAGDGPLKTQLKSQISNLGLSKRVKLLGQVSNSKIPALLSSAHIFIRPSRKEGFGVAFIEAMASGVPIIGTNVGGISDFLIHRQTGLFAEVDDPQSIADQIMALYHDKKLYRQIQTNAKKMVKQTYIWDKIALAVEKQFLNLCH